MIARVRLNQAMGVAHTATVPALVRLELLCAVTEADGPFHAVAMTAADGRYDVDVVDGAGRVCVTLRGYGTAALPGSVDTEILEPLRTVPA